MQKIFDYDRKSLVSMVMTDEKQTSFSVNPNDILTTDVYIRLNMAGNKKIVFIPWHQIKELTIEEVEENDDKNKQLRSSRIIQSGSADS